MHSGCIVFPSLDPTAPLKPLTHATVREWTKPAEAIFRIAPKMTKTEVREYLTKIYDLPVTQVNTINYLGK